MDEVNTSLPPGLTPSIAESTFRVPPTFTLNVRSRSRSLPGGSSAAKCSTALAPATASRTPSASVTSPRAISISSLPSSPEKIHRRQVEDPDRLARRREHLDKLPPDAAPPPPVMSTGALT